MQTKLADWIRETPAGIEADAILRKCVHCGFCLATCPTYDLLGDELDSPRGRIYLMKQMLEGAPVSWRTQLHLDRCLTCRACETTCPSGVQYGRLADIGRELVEERVDRPVIDRLRRWLLKQVIPSRALFGSGLALARLARPLLPAALRRKVPARRAAGPWPATAHARRVLRLGGCVQPAIAPSIDAAAARVLDSIGISLVDAPGSGCCGAVTYHLNDQHGAVAYMKRNIDAWWPFVEAGAEAIAITASGCGTMVKDYGHVLRDDAKYAARAARISALAKDISEVIAAERAALLPQLAKPPRPRKVAFQSPCSLQHGQKIVGAVEGLLRDAGYALTAVPDGHLCCGSAGTYSILHPELSQRLLHRKVRALEGGSPDEIATANIGCLTHIESATALPIRHWIELIDERLAAG